MQLQDELGWGGWATSATPEAEWPEAALRGSSAFQRLLFLQACRPERLESGMGQYAILQSLPYLSSAPLA